MEKLEKLKQRKRAAIVNAAQELLLQYGSEKMSVREIAKLAGVSQVTIYNHFEDKESLVYETVFRLVHQYLEQYRTIINSDDTFEEKLKRVLSIRHDINLRGTWYSLVSIAKKDRHIRELVESVYEEHMKIELLKLIAQGREQHHISPSVSQEAVLIYITMFKNYYLEPQNAALFLNNEGLVKELWTLFWNGLSGKV